MKDSILTSLKTKYTGVQAAILDRVANHLSKTVTEESQIETAVSGVKDMVNDFSSFFQSEIDRRVQDSIKTHETTLKEKFDFVEKKKEPEKKTIDPNDIAAIVKAAVEDAVKPYKEKMEGFEQKTSSEKLYKTLSETLIGEKYKGGFGIPKDDVELFGLMSNVKLEKAEDVPTIAQSINDQYTKKVQAFQARGFVPETPKGGNVADSTVASLESWGKKLEKKD